MKCYPDCNSNSCCVHQLDGRRNHSVKSHFPQCCACFLYLLPFHQNHGINSTESCFPVEHRWLYWGAKEGENFLWAVSTACTMQLFALSGTYFRKSQVWRELELRLKPMCMLMCFSTCKMPAGGCWSVPSYTLYSCKAGHFAICFRRFWRSSSEGRSPTFWECHLWCFFFRKNFCILYREY